MSVRLARPALLGCLALAACATGCDSTADPGEPAFVPQFVSARRAWQPGERAARIDSIVTNREWVFPFVGDLSDLAPTVYADPDSVVVVIPNPALTPAPLAGPYAAPQFAASWFIIGVDVRSINTNQVPADTLDWIGVFWANPSETSWKGIILMDRCTSFSGPARTTCRSTRSPTGPGGNAIVVNTAAFNAASAKDGAGGGELRFSTGEYWEANGGKIKITAASYGSASTVTSGPFTGGTSASGTMGGQLEDITMPRLDPSPGPAITVSFGFESTPIASIRLTCVFPSPCTTNTPLEFTSVRY